MLPYLITFTLSITAYRFATKPLKKWVRMLFLILSILPPTILAGLRDAKLGRDWFGYGIDIWNLATNHNLYQTLTQFQAIEPGYKLLNYIIGYFSFDCHIFFFFHQMILVSIAVFISYRYRKYRCSEVILLFYFLYVFNTSMTIIRQSIALMLCQLAFMLWDSNLRKKSIAFIGIAFFFHFSSVFASFIYILSICKNFLRKHQILIPLTIILITYFTTNSFTHILTKLIELNIFSWHYIGYADQMGEVSIHKTDLIFQISILLLTILPIKAKNNVISSQILYFALIAISLNMFGNITDVAFRVAHYFVLPIAILMPRISSIPKENTKACLLFSFLLIARFAYFAYANGAENTIPYSSDLLGI